MPEHKILLVDDSEADLELIKLTLTELEQQMSVELALDGQAAFDHLLARLDRTQEQPELIVLDWNMPRLDGRGFLIKLRAHEALRAIPVIVFTSSDSKQDVASSYAHGASCFLKKPIGLDELQTVLQAVKGFWMDTAKLPGSRR